MRVPRWIKKVDDHFNFFRYHLLFFSVTPVIFACILYAGNGSAGGNANRSSGIAKVEFIDALFLCYSAMTVTGLVTVNVSQLHPFQQALLFILFILGDYSFVAYIMVTVRKRFFQQHCREVLKNTNALKPSRTFTFSRKTRNPGEDDEKSGGFRRLYKSLGVEPKSSDKAYRGQKISSPRDGRLLDEYMDERSPVVKSTPFTGGREDFNEKPAEGVTPQTGPSGSGTVSTTAGSGDSVDGNPGTVSNGIISDDPKHHATHADPSGSRPRTSMDRTGTVHFKDPIGPFSSPQVARRHLDPVDIDEESSEAGRDTPPTRQAYASATNGQNGSAFANGLHARTLTQLPRAPTIPTTYLTRSQTHLSRTPTRATHVPMPHKSVHSGFGGFNAIHMIEHLLPTSFTHNVRRGLGAGKPHLTLLTNPTMSPEDSAALHRTVTRSMSLDPNRQGTLGSRVENLLPNRGDETSEPDYSSSLRGKVAHWLPDSLQGLVIGRNSRFYTEDLDDEVIEQLGGVEYKALRFLSWLVPIYIFSFQFIPFVIIAIYLACIHDWDSAFIQNPGVQAGMVNKTWWAFFISTSAYSGSGMSLVDQSMAPFNNCYFVLLILTIVVIVGNHALPMMLRLVIWLKLKITRDPDERRTIHFLLDHPRRCFLYLFPSTQTWYLFLTFASFLIVEMIGFLALDIGLPVLTSLRRAERFVDALLQSASVRASGFGVVAVPSLAPSVLVLYVVLMYVAIYPIALSVRSTNVYEEQALGVYEADDPVLAGDDAPAYTGKRPQVVGKYLLWHLRRQLAFDIWPLALAIFLILCFERGKLLDPARIEYFSIFRIIFECTSAYSTIGLSLGVPFNNFSFSGDLGTVSKLVVIGVMLRGRHRGLPVAIDRAILLPHEYEQNARRGSGSSKPPDTVEQRT